MNHRQRKRIVIASILKPVDDTRMFEKMGVSLANSNEFEVTIIGYPTTQRITSGQIQIVALKRFKRLSIERWFASFRVLQILFKVKPEVLIINTHELLIVAFLFRILFGGKILYDIQENYFRNLMHTSAFPTGIRQILALWIRLKEKLLVPFFQGSFLAEKGYEKEMDFFGQKYVVVENKVIVPSHFVRTSKTKNAINLVFTGTLAESTGVFQAIGLAKVLHELDTTIHLKLIGYCAQPSVMEKIKYAIYNCAYIQFIGGDYLIPHNQIMDAIHEADFGIVCYPSSVHTENSIPTKLYEYLGLQLPILLQNHPPWIDLCIPYRAAVIVDFDRPNPSRILSDMKDPFYTTPPRNVSWKSEEQKMLEAIRAIIHK
jgi:hypothetical protein